MAPSAGSASTAMRRASSVLGPAGLLTTARLRGGATVAAGRGGGVHVVRNEGKPPPDQGDVAMTFIVFTRLRLKDPALNDEFFTDAVAAIEQAQKSDGNLGVDALADANNTWWTVTAWPDRKHMNTFVGTEPHRGIMS